MKCCWSYMISVGQCIISWALLPPPPPSTPRVFKKDQTSPFLSTYLWATSIPDKKNEGCFNRRQDEPERGVECRGAACAQRLLLCCALKLCALKAVTIPCMPAPLCTTLCISTTSALATACEQSSRLLHSALIGRTLHISCKVHAGYYIAFAERYKVYIWHAHSGN